MLPISKRIGLYIIAIAVIGGSFFTGLTIGSNRTPEISNEISGITNQNENVGTADFSLFWKAWQILDEKYVPTHGTTTITNQDKVYGAIKGLAESYGDPYTTFFPPVDNKDFQAEISGNFEGVGMQIGVDNGVLTVIAPLKGSPAEKAGIKAGDQILKIDSTITATISVDDAVNLMRGNKGTTVTLTVISKNQTTSHEVKIIRDTIDIPTLDTELRPDGVFVIRLYTFTANSAVLFRQGLQKFVDSHSNKLVLDLRGNPGGYLEAAVDMASWFLPSNKVVVKEDGGMNGSTVYNSKGYDVFNKNLKMVILVDGGSASASEILSGALQQNGVAQLVGEQTYGKGSVQELVPLTSDTALKITIARWLTPNGTSISDHGLTPDVVVKVTQDDVAKGVDAQLNKAVEILNK